MATSQTKGKTVTLKVKYSDFQQITRSKTVEYWVDSAEQVADLYQELAGSIPMRQGIRLLGLTLSNLNHEQQERKAPAVTQLTISF